MSVRADRKEPGADQAQRLTRQSKINQQHKVISKIGLYSRLKSRQGSVEGNPMGEATVVKSKAGSRAGRGR